MAHVFVCLFLFFFFLQVLLGFCSADPPTAFHQLVKLQFEESHVCCTLRVLVSDCWDTISTLTAIPTHTFPPPTHPFTLHSAVVLPELLSCCAQITPTLPCFVLVTVWFQHRPIWTDAELKQILNEMTQKESQNATLHLINFPCVLVCFQSELGTSFDSKSHGLKLFSYWLTCSQKMLTMSGWFPSKKRDKGNYKK